MAKTAMKIKQQRKPKFSTQQYSRCRICGRIQGTDPRCEESKLVKKRKDFLRCQKTAPKKN